MLREQELAGLPVGGRRILVLGHMAKGTADLGIAGASLAGEGFCAAAQGLGAAPSGSVFIHDNVVICSNESAAVQHWSRQQGQQLGAGVRPDMPILIAQAWGAAGQEQQGPLPLPGAQQGPVAFQQQPVQPAGQGPPAPATPALAPPAPPPPPPPPPQPQPGGAHPYMKTDEDVEAARLYQELHLLAADICGIQYDAVVLAGPEPRRIMCTQALRWAAVVAVECLPQCRCSLNVCGLC